MFICKGKTGGDMRVLFKGLRTLHAVTFLFLLGGQVVFADTTLLMAAKKGDFSTLESLIQDKYANINEAQADGTTALHWVVYKNDREMVDILVNAGANVNVADDYGVSPLHLACTNQNAMIVKSLLDAGANPNVAKWTGETPLMTCASTGTTEAVKDLLARGADVNAKETMHEQTALMWAAAEKRPAIVKMLIDAGANVQARSKIIPEPEPYLIETEATMGKNFVRTTRFREFTGGFTALLFAAQQGDIESAGHLLNAGADINDSNGEDGSALLIATASGHEDMAIYLLERGADPDNANPWGLAPLHYAVQKGILNMSNWIPSVTDELGWVHEPMHRLIKKLIEYGADINARVEYTLPYIDDLFLRNHDNQSQIDIVGSTPLHLAAASGDTESIRIMVENSDGIDIINSKTIGGATVLMLAAGAGSERGARDEKQAIEATKYVLSLFPDDVSVPAQLSAQLTYNDAVNGPGAGKIDGRTIMHFAVTQVWKDMMSFLVENGADLEVADRYGMTPLMIAMGDPEARYYRNVGVGRYDDRYRRRPANDVLEKLLLDLGAEPFTGTFVYKGSVD